MSAEPRVLLPPGVELEWTVREPGEEARQRGLVRGALADAAGGAVSVVAALLGALVGLRLWEADWSTPFSYTHDGLLILGLVKSVLEEGWWLSNTALAAPFGQELHDYPFAAGNALHLVLLRLLGAALGDATTTVNAYYVAGFGVIALVAYVVFRRLALSVSVAAFAAFVFAVLPYHFGRNVDHLFLSSYFTVPLAAYLIVNVFAGRALFELGASDGHVARYGRVLVVVLMCVAVGAAATYYALFTVLLLLVGGVLSTVAHPRLGSLPGAALASAVILATLTAAFTPVLVHRFEAGANTEVAARSPEEAERLSLRLSELVLPVRHHRLDPLATLRERYETRTPLPSESNQALGLVATLGLIGLLVVAAAAAVGRRWATGPVAALPPVAAATVTAVLLATTGGFSTILGYVGIAQLRGWNRMTIFVAFFCLLAAGAFLEAIRGRLTSRRARVAFCGGLVVLGGVALLDQTNESFVPPYAANKGEYVSDRAFVRSIERELGGGASVYQLPFVSFPEEPNPPGGMSAYAHLAGYAHSDRLRWSFGAIRGRDGDWAAALAPKPTETMLLAVAAAGFAGVYVDRLGYDDAGSRLLGELGALAGRPRYSTNERRAFVDLRAYRRRLASDFGRSQLDAIRALTLSPVRSDWGSSFWQLESAGPDSWRWTRSRRASFELANPSDRTRLLDVRFVVAAGVHEPAQATVTWPSGYRVLVPISPRGVSVGRRIALPPGRSTVTIETNAQRAITPPEDPRDALYVRVVNTSIRDITFAPLLADAPAVAPLFSVTAANVR